MDKVGIGVIGLGALGLLHADNIRQKIRQAELVAICHYRPDRIRQLQQELDIPYAYDNFDKMLQNPEIDAVIVASPTSTHHEHVLKACRAGRHVFCEKPLGMNLRECLDIEKAARQNCGKCFMVGFMRRFDPSYREAVTRIKSGEIGKPLFFRGYSLDPITTAREMAKKAETTNLWFMEMTVHDIDLVRWIMQSEPAYIYAAGGAYMFPEFNPYHDIDNGFALIKLDSGACAFLYSGRTAPHGCHVETEIVGEKAAIRIGAVPYKNRIQIYKPYGLVEEGVPDYLYRWNEAYYLEIKHFIDCILQGRQPEITAYDGRMATQIAECVQQSFVRNERIAFNSEIQKE